MMLPGLLYLLINNYLPMFGIIIAFEKINFSQGLLHGVFSGKWVGLDNFKFLFNTNDAWLITRNTIFYNLLFIVLNTVFGLVLALLLKQIRSKLMTGVFQGVLLFPNFISWVVVSYLVLAFLNVSNGFLNKTILPALGLQAVSWYMEPRVWPVILTVVNLWKSAGLHCIIYYSAIIAIDPTLYEAAALDGAGRWKQFTSITLSELAPIIVMMVLLSVGKIMYSDFGLFYQIPLDTGILYDTTGTIDTYVFRALTKLGNVGMSAAVGVYQSLVGFILVLASNLLVRWRNPDNALL